MSEDVTMSDNVMSKDVTMSDNVMSKDVTIPYAWKFSRPVLNFCGCIILRIFAVVGHVYFILYIQY